MTDILNSGGWIKSASAALRADAKKTVAITVLAAVMLVMWGRILTGGAPKPAAAMSLQGSRSVTSLSAGGSSHAGASNAALGAWLAGPITTPDRNVFAIKLDYFQQDGSRQADAPGAISDRIGKSQATQADQKKEREILIDNLRTQAAQLQLESTVMGSQPRAMVNGSLVGVGDVIANFRIQRIEQRRIIVEREGIRLEIAMN